MAPNKTRRDELLAHMTAPGTAAGVVLQQLAQRPWQHRRIDVDAIAGATGESTVRVAWGLTVLRILGLLPVSATPARATSAPRPNVAPTTIMMASDRQRFTKDWAIPAPAPTAPMPKDPPRLDEPRRQTPGSAVEVAVAWLLETLTDRPLRASEVRRRADEAGIAWRTLQRARASAGVEARRLGDGVGIWVRRDLGRAR